MRISDCGFPHSSNPQSAIRNPQLRDTRSLPPAPSLLPPRPGISLTEVLIAMGILTIGLLGVMAMFPVGSFYMQQAEIADRGQAIARQVMSECRMRLSGSSSAIFRRKVFLTRYEFQEIVCCRCVSESMARTGTRDTLVSRSFQLVWRHVRTFSIGR